LKLRRRKRASKVFSTVLMILRIFLTIALSWLLIENSSGQATAYKEVARSTFTHSHSDLASLYSGNKSFLNEFELQSLIALSYYPELKNIKVSFEYADIRTTMSVRPKIFSTLTANRHYLVFIDTNAHNNGILLKDVPFNGQVGIIGHELAHIVNYEKRSSVSLMGLGIVYAIHNHHAHYERSIDKLAISKGLGWQLLAWADYALNKSTASLRYKAFKEANYLTPSEIEKQLAKYAMYSLTD
jgi:hypothetical protein